MIALYFPLAFIIFIIGLIVYQWVTRKPLSETVLASIATTLVALLTRGMTGEVEGTISIKFHVVKADELFVHFGGIGFAYYFGIAIAFMATFMAYGGNVYVKQRELE